MDVSLCNNKIYHHHCHPSHHHHQLLSSSHIGPAPRREPAPPRAASGLLTAHSGYLAARIQHVRVFTAVGPPRPAAITGLARWHIRMRSAAQLPPINKNRRPRPAGSRHRGVYIHASVPAYVPARRLHFCAPRSARGVLRPLRGVPTALRRSARTHIRTHARTRHPTARLTRRCTSPPPPVRPRTTHPSTHNLGHRKQALQPPTPSPVQSLPYRPTQ